MALAVLAVVALAIVAVCAVTGVVVSLVSLASVTAADIDVIVRNAMATGAAIRRIGGATGWYYANWLWRVRGFIDLLEGGVGLRRGRPSATTLHVGDTVDSFRVESIEPHRRLRLKSEMHLYGRAWLEFEVTGQGEGIKVFHGRA
mgnify:CR=1 FL=1